MASPSRLSVKDAQGPVLDYRICGWVCLMFFALQLDRGNISQALTDNMLADLRLTTDQYNAGMTLFYVAFLAAELPSQALSKKLGPDVWIPVQMVLWSAVAASQSAMRGALEGGFVPDAILYLSYFYDSRGLPVRVGWFYSAHNATPVVAAFLAYAILHMRGVAGWEGWRWLFVLEAALAGAIGVLSWFYLPPSPTQTASWTARRAGSPSARSKKGAASPTNHASDTFISQGGMHNRQGLTLPLLRQALADFDLWPLYLLGLTLLLPVIPIMNYLTLNLRGLGFSTFETNLLTIPAYGLFIAQLLFWAPVSERIDNRFGVTLFYSAWLFPLFVALRALPADADAWLRYGVTVSIVGYPYVHSILVSLTSRNAGSVQTRTVGSAVYNMCVQGSSIMGSNIYRQDDAPLYNRGNTLILGIIAWNAVFTLLIKCYYMWRNGSCERIWNAMTSQQKDEYLATTSDQGSRRLDFRTGRRTPAMAPMCSREYCTKETRTQGNEVETKLAHSGLASPSGKDTSRTRCMLSFPERRRRKMVSALDLPILGRLTVVPHDPADARTQNSLLRFPPKAQPVGLLHRKL
ncbi:Putative Phthalate transporter [Tolypocladium paradoxum]|uniref:Phthalate transporter n=1 Tax=Tolypocladium paradoxum TaxID=94208 RepID=A0A2S4KYJ8_9HYPO|nr:Putative Phthalate transporter [Tolypocladium paradoxum]